jgi:Ser/Thr protein kinase RdoA (MazF antagonist)
MGRVAGQVGTALAAFDHPGLDRAQQWDLRHADGVVDRLARHVADPEQRAAADAWARLPADLPRQAVHLDLTDDNVVCAPRAGRRVPDGVIDLGDLTRTWAVFELAVTISSVLHHAGAEPASVLPAVRAFHDLRPLSSDEIDALWPLVVLRGAVLDGDNAYAQHGLDAEWEIFARAASVPVEVMTALLRDALQLRRPCAESAAPATLLTHDTPDLLDLSVGSDAMDGGAWLRPRESARSGARVGTDGARVVRSPPSTDGRGWSDHRCSRPSRRRPHPPASTCGRMPTCWRPGPGR